MKSLRNFFYKLSRSTRERKAGRAQLKLASSGDQEQYLALASNYLNLAQTYFGNSISEPDSKRNARTIRLFIELWQQLGYAERLSDFEYMLGQALIASAPSSEPVTSQEKIVTKLRLLSPDTRFAILAHEFANWPSRWIALVMRIKADRLHNLLSEARCELSGISWDSLTIEEKSCLESISASFCKCPDVKQNKTIQQKAKDLPRISEIKALWLELRPEFVEAKLRYAPEQNIRELLLREILNGIECESIIRPPLWDRMVNTVHFSRHSKIRVS